MGRDAVICDWNGTIISFRDEKPLLKHIAVDVFKSSFPFHPARMARILLARRELEALYSTGRRDEGFDYVREMFRVYNSRIIRGVPVPVVERSVDRYALLAEIQRQLDRRVLAAMEACHAAGRTTGILSAGYSYGIKRILSVGGYDGCFDFVEADGLSHDNGIAVELGLTIHRKKAKLLPELLDRKAIDAAKAAYIGDSEDDEGCFEVVGYPVVAFYAEAEFKRRCADKYGAFVPETERDLREYLVGW